MIYELAYVIKPNSTDETIAKIKGSVTSALKELGAELLVEDDWGIRTFAQPTEKGETRGRFIYVMYQAENSELNKEVQRKLKIDEDVLRSMFVKLGNEADKEKLVKNYKNPMNQPRDESGIDPQKEKKIFLKKKSCYFSAKKTAPDWKDPSSYAWLVNEFGKITPARVSGLRPKFQRMATVAIKRGRCMGMISYMSNEVLR